MFVQGRQIFYWLRDDRRGATPSSGKDHRSFVAQMAARVSLNRTFFGEAVLLYSFEAGDWCAAASRCVDMDAR